MLRRQRHHGVIFGLRGEDARGHRVRVETLARRRGGECGGRDLVVRHGNLDAFREPIAHATAAHLPYRRRVPRDKPTMLKLRQHCGDRSRTERCLVCRECLRPHRPAECREQHEQLTRPRGQRSHPRLEHHPLPQQLSNPRRRLTLPPMLPQRDCLLLEQPLQRLNQREGNPPRCRQQLRRKLPRPRRGRQLAESRDKLRGAREVKARQFNPRQCSKTTQRIERRPRGEHHKNPPPIEPCGDGVEHAARLGVGPVDVVNEERERRFLTHRTQEIEQRPHAATHRVLAGGVVGRSLAEGRGQRRRECHEHTCTLR